MINVLILQHADDEWIGSIEPWMSARNATLTTVRLDKGEPLPDIRSYDWLLIMGGPMSAYDEVNYPWLKAEKQLIKDAISSKKTVLGICLGGQLIASALGCSVKPNSEQEIGWFEVTRLDETATWLPRKFRPLSWHGDIFELPEGAAALAESRATPCQGFTWGEKVVALQFHLEAKAGTAEGFLAHEQKGLPAGRFVQGASELLTDGPYLADSRKAMHALLDRLI